MLPLVPLALGEGESALADLQAALPTLTAATCYVLGDLSACGIEDSQAIFNHLSLAASAFHHVYLVGLTLPGIYLAGAEPSAYYPMAVLITATGGGYGVAGKVSLPHLSTRAGYAYWWRLALNHDGKSESAIVLLGSDILYLALGIEPADQYLADWLIVLDAGSPGTARATSAILARAVDCGWTKATVLVDSAVYRNHPNQGPNALGAVVDWVPGALPPWSSGLLERLDWMRRYGCWLPDRYFDPAASFQLAEWTEPGFGRVALPFSACEKRPKLSDWPYGPIVLEG